VGYRTNIPLCGETIKLPCIVGNYSIIAGKPIVGKRHMAVISELF